MLVFKRAAISVLMKLICAGQISKVKPRTSDGLCTAYWCSLISYLDLFGLESGIVFQRTTGVYEQIHRFDLQTSKREREIWINNMDKTKWYYKSLIKMNFI